MQISGNERLSLNTHVAVAVFRSISKVGVAFTWYHDSLSRTNEGIKLGVSGQNVNRLWIVLRMLLTQKYTNYRIKSETN